MFGGPVLDAPTLLARLIATLHDAEGSVAIEGLVSRDDVAVDLTEEEYRADASVLDGVRLAGTGSIASRLWTKPALSIIGIDAPAVDVASNTLLPAGAGQVQPAPGPRAGPGRRHGRRRAGTSKRTRRSARRWCSPRGRAATRS